MQKCLKKEGLHYEDAIKIRSKIPSELNKNSYNFEYTVAHKGVQYDFEISIFKEDISNQEISKSVFKEILLQDVFSEFKSICRYYDYLKEHNFYSDEEYDEYESIESLGFTFDESDNLVPYDGFGLREDFEWDIGKTIFNNAEQNGDKYKYVIKYQNTPLKIEISWNVNEYWGELD
ncbi:hypothetical protein [Bacillus pumilus]|uniref:hypothetical protein n=1 Tax=Bacillus pumilus TaxID=1408 RepID=UPI0011A87842|nr:hypothetical protein [Bacillus pumilus]